MSNKTSDKNVANIEDFIKVYKETKMQKNVIENIDKDYFTEFVDRLIEKLDDKDKRIKELEEELAEFNKQLDLDYVDENYIPKQVVIDKIDELGISDEDINIRYVLQELLEGEKNRNEYRKTN